MNERSDTPRTDAIVRSHVQDGALGAIFCAVMLSIKQRP